MWVVWACWLWRWGYVSGWYARRYTKRRDAPESVSRFTGTPNSVPCGMCLHHHHPIVSRAIRIMAYNLVRNLLAVKSLLPVLPELSEGFKFRYVRAHKGSARPKVIVCNIFTILRTGKFKFIQFEFCKTLHKITKLIIIFSNMHSILQISENIQPILFIYPDEISS